MAGDSYDLTAGVPATRMPATEPERRRVVLAQIRATLTLRHMAADDLVDVLGLAAVAAVILPGHSKPADTTRRCQGPDCRVSLEGRPSRQRYCDQSCGSRGRTAARKAAA